MQTRLTDMLEVEHPVMLAGMGGVSYHRLVAAVSEAGGFGCMGAAPMQPQQMVEEIETSLGVVEGSNGRVTGFTEKPRISLTAATGINVGEPSILTRLPADDSPFDFPDLVQALLGNGGQVSAYPLEGTWFDIGTFGEFEKAQAEVERHPELYGD